MNSNTQSGRECSSIKITSNLWRTQQTASFSVDAWTFVMKLFISSALHRFSHVSMTEFTEPPLPNTRHDSFRDGYIMRSRTWNCKNNTENSSYIPAAEQEDEISFCDFILVGGAVRRISVWCKDHRAGRPWQANDLDLVSLKRNWRHRPWKEVLNTVNNSVGLEHVLWLLRASTLFLRRKSFALPSFSYVIGSWVVGGGAVLYYIFFPRDMGRLGHRTRARWVWTCVCCSYSQAIFQFVDY